jgi:hypothetical protein
MKTAPFTIQISLVPHITKIWEKPNQHPQSAFRPAHNFMPHIIKKNKSEKIKIELSFNFRRSAHFA